MQYYVRFQTSLRCEWTARPLGIFHAAGQVIDRDEIETHSRDMLCEQIEWFDLNLVAPTVRKSRWQCLYWFREAASDLITRLWDVATLLREQDVYVEKCRTNSPGTIVYSDQYQIAAIPARRRRR